MKMRTRLLIAAICILSQNSFGQETNVIKLAGGISADYGIANHIGYGTFGLDAWVPINNKVTLNYSIRMGIPRKGIFYRGSAGILAGGVIFSLIDETSILVAPIGAILMLIPEGIGFYAGQNKRKIHIGINPLAGEYRYISYPASEWYKLGANITLRGQIQFNKFGIDFISPFFASYYNYSYPHAIGYRVGISAEFCAK